MFLSSSGLGLGFDNPLSSQIEEKPLLYSVRVCDNSFFEDVGGGAGRSFRKEN